LIPRLATRPGPWALGPTFSGSAMIGGADGDLIAAGLLLELKTSAKLTLAVKDLFQVVGYALLDFDDEYKLTEVGIFSAPICLPGHLGPGRPAQRVGRATGRPPVRQAGVPPATASALEPARQSRFGGSLSAAAAASGSSRDQLHGPHSVSRVTFGGTGQQYPVSVPGSGLSG
jgi:hypothetical protein